MQPVLLIILFNLVVFFRTLRFSITIDDISWYKRIQDGGFDWMPSFKNFHWWISQRLSGGGTFGRAKPGESADAHIDHAFAILLHTTASVLIYYAFGQSSVSFWAAILYACNPTNAQTSVWLNGRRYLMNVILTLVMVIFPLSALILYPATGLFHVTAIFVPVLFLGLYSIPLIGIFYLLFSKQIREKIGNRMASIHSKDWKNFTPKRLIVSVKCYGFYFFRSFLPGVTLMNYPTLFSWGVTKKGNDDAYAYNFDFYKGLAGLIITLGVIFILPAVYRPYAVFAFLAILQWCAIIPATQLLADRYTSTAMPFMMFFLAYFIQSPLIMSCIAGFYVARLWSCMEMFESIWGYFKYQIYHAPHITTPRKDLITYCIKKGDHMSAWHYTREGLDYEPKDFALLHRAALCAQACGSRKQALEYVVMAEQNFYIDQEESQKAWCDSFKDQMKKQDLAQLNNKRFGG